MHAISTRRVSFEVSLFGGQSYSYSMKWCSYSYSRRAGRVRVRAPLALSTSTKTTGLHEGWVRDRQKSATSKITRRVGIGTVNIYVFCSSDISRLFANHSINPSNSFLNRAKTRHFAIRTAFAVIPSSLATSLAERPSTAYLQQASHVNGSNSARIRSRPRATR
jgi:hypothetical protein